MARPAQLRSRLSRLAAIASLGLALACAAESPHSPAPAPARVAEASAEFIEVGGARLYIQIEGELGELSRADIHKWVRRSAQMVSEYYDGFPVPSMQILVTLHRGAWVGHGRHKDGRWIRVSVGRETSLDALTRDWVMPHEMLHAGFPDVVRRHHWMQEGLSTYLEGVVRARAGVTSDEEMWTQWVKRMPKGRPLAGDEGLDHTRTWARLYWGGALFWMVLDVELRRATDNRESLQSLVQGLIAAGGDGRADWSSAQVRQVCDQATGTTVFSEVYARMAEAPGDVDLYALWAELGVIDEGAGVVRFDDEAPLAELRRAVTSATPAG